MEQQDLQKRLLIALALSFLVFIAFTYFFPTQNVSQTANGNATQSSTMNQAPDANTKSAPQTAGTSAAAAAPVTVSQSLATVTSNHFIMTIDTYGRIAQMELLESKYKDENGKALKILDPNEVKPLEIRFSDAALNEEAFKTPYTIVGSDTIDVTTASGTLVLEQRLSSLTVTKKITFQPTGAYDIAVTTSSEAPYFITPGYRPVADHSMYMVIRGALIKTNDDIIKTIEDGDAKGDESFADAKIASALDRYYASLFYDFDRGLDVSVLKEKDDNPLIFVKGNSNMNLHGYLGPKDHQVLKAINPELTDAIEFGWFSFLAIPFFKVLLWIHSYIGNWGWAIIIFTLLVKTVLFPLSYKGMMSMQKLKDLAPKMKDLREKYKGDPAKMNMQMMELYKKHGANPMGGCLPMLLQIPVFFALYRVLLNADELQGASWMLWINDLSRMDPYFILPVLMGLSMFVQQKITPSNFTDPLQEKIFRWFPVMMTVFFVYFPAGLVLYWLVNNIFTIAQQYYINHMYAKHKEAAIALHHKGKDGK